MTDDADLRAQILAILERTREDVLALVEAHVGPHQDPPEPAAPAKKWIPMKAAAKLRGCTVETMTRHVIERDLGQKVDGRWQVDEARVLAWLAGDLDPDD